MTELPVRVAVEDNPNCAGCGEIVFTPTGPVRRITGIIAAGPRGDEEHDVVGVDAGGKWIDAHAQKVADSGDGHAYLIFGGAWGIRIRPRSLRGEPWNLGNSRQTGESHKLYGTENEILYAERRARIR